MLSAEVKLQLPGFGQGEALPILDHVAPGPVLGLHLTIGYSMVQLHRLMAGYYHLGLRDSFPILSHSLNVLILNLSLRLDLSCVRLDLLKDCPILIGSGEHFETFQQCRHRCIHHLTQIH